MEGAGGEAIDSNKQELVEKSRKHGPLLCWTYTNLVQSFFRAGQASCFFSKGLLSKKTNSGPTSWRGPIKRKSKGEIFQSDFDQECPR